MNEETPSIEEPENEEEGASKISSEPAFVCDCKKWARSACTGLPFYKEKEGKRYCVLHYPSKEKSADFEKELHRKARAKSFDFQGVWFPDALDFSEQEFPTHPDFSEATFIAAVDFSYVVFKVGADFSEATFSAEANFKQVTFESVGDFSEATFSAKAYFRRATFIKAAFFSEATFSAEADFNQATFGAKVFFNGTTFKDYVRFTGSGDRKVFDDRSSLSLHHARFEKPDRVSFHTLTLRPHWFVNVDASKVKFTEIKWPPTAFNIKKEIEALKGNKVKSPYGLFSIACRQLAINAEENHRYQESCDFRFMSMDAKRRDPEYRFRPWRLHWWYWAASGYGEKIWKAFLMLVGIWIIFAWLYTEVGLTEPISFARSLTYSLGVMSLQKPEPKPVTSWAHFVVTLESIIGPVQVALLALAIRRKFMR